MPEISRGSDVAVHAAAPLRAEGLQEATPLAWGMGPPATPRPFSWLLWMGLTRASPDPAPCPQGASPDLDHGLRRLQTLTAALRHLQTLTTALRPGPGSPSPRLQRRHVPPDSPVLGSLGSPWAPLWGLLPIYRLHTNHSVSGAKGN